MRNNDASVQYIFRNCFWTAIPDAREPRPDESLFRICPRRFAGFDFSSLLFISQRLRCFSSEKRCILSSLILLPTLQAYYDSRTYQPC